MEAQTTKTDHLGAILLKGLDQHCARYLELRTQLKAPGLNTKAREELEADLAGIIALLESSAEQYADL